MSSEENIVRLLKDIMDDYYRGFISETLSSIDGDLTGLLCLRKWKFS